MNKHELAKKISALEGLTNEEKSELIKLLRTQKKYGLVWEDKPEETELRLQEELPVLEEVADRALISDDPAAPNHILIEGDNLEALTALTYTHSGKIDVIYIDPPYNTGNKDFVYNDSYVDKEDGYRHSKWLSFMNKRLKIAKGLLSEKGVIFISIDDNEQAQLKMLCDEIFGEGNYIGSLPRITKKSGKSTDKIASNHDYLLIFTKNIKEVEIKGLPHNDKGFKYEDEFKDKRGAYKLNQTLDYDSLQYSSSLDYPIEIEGYTMYPGGSYQQYIERQKGNHKSADWAWRWSKELYQFGLSNHYVVLKKSRNGLRIYTKTYQFAKIVKDEDTDQYKIEYSDRVKAIDSLALTDTIYSNDNAKKELKRIFAVLPFEHPKPTSLLQTFLRAIQAKTVLDFFAGSGTTLHAAMQLNAEDGGHRQCILVQGIEKDAKGNDKKICENVTYERNKRVIQGYTTPKGEQVAGLTHNTLRYYKTKLLPREQTMKNMRALMDASTELLCIKHDVYQEQTLFAGRKLKPSCARYFDNGKTRMLVIYNELTVDAIARALSGWDVEGKILVYVFSATRYAYDDNFADVLDKVELCALPAAIYDAYKNVLPAQAMGYEQPLVEAEDGQ